MPEQHSGKRGQSMDYKLVISEHADELLDNIVYYLLYRLKSEQAVRHLLEGIDGIYDRMETNPFQFPLSRDAYPMCRKTPCFSYGDIRHVHRIYASN